MLRVKKESLSQIVFYLDFHTVCYSTGAKNVTDYFCLAFLPPLQIN